MHKKALSILVFFACYSATVLAQIPDGYYNEADGKMGQELKTALYNIIKGHTEKTYGDARYILDETDADTTNADNVLTIYSSHSVSGKWDSGITWNREHVWAKSRGFGDVDNNTKGPGSDLHNLRACISDINTARNNRWFGECEKHYEYEGVYTGTNYGSPEWLWEPRDEDKGDVARIMFYMATRYEGEGDEPDLELIDYLPADNYTNDPIFAKLSDLIAWNTQDPVNNFEKHRNEVIYSYQKNRNPFIDHPEYVYEIWGATGIENNSVVQTVLYPNPAKTEVKIKSDEIFQSITLYNIIGVKLMDIPADSKTIYVGDLTRGQYFVVVTSTKNTKALPLLIVD